jgi:hypothetical protein
VNRIKILQGFNFTKIVGFTVVVCLLILLKQIPMYLIKFGLQVRHYFFNYTVKTNSHSNVRVLPQGFFSYSVGGYGMFLWAVSYSPTFAPASHPRRQWPAWL